MKYDKWVDPVLPPSNPTFEDIVNTATERLLAGDEAWDRGFVGYPFRQATQGVGRVFCKVAEHIRGLK